MASAPSSMGLSRPIRGLAQHAIEVDAGDVGRGRKHNADADHRPAVRVRRLLGERKIGLDGILERPPRRRIGA